MVWRNKLACLYWSSFFLAVELRGTLVEHFTVQFQKWHFKKINCYKHSSLFYLIVGNKHIFFFRLSLGCWITKHFYSCNCICTEVIYSVGYPHLIFAVKTGAHLSGAPHRSLLLWQAPGLDCKYETWEKVSHGDKHSSLVKNRTNYSCKKFYNSVHRKIWDNIQRVF